jgi:thiosulfate/3-mercaptopyruvate sulfurtransferase
MEGHAMSQPDAKQLRDNVLISAEDLKKALATDRSLVVLDVRADPESGDRRADYLAGHIPGALYIDLDTELSGLQIGYSGRLPLPNVRDLQRDARRWGINHDSRVVVYDDTGGLQAGRAWWVLRWAGLANVRLLNGGLAAWSEIGGELSNEVRLPALGKVTLFGGQLPVVDADDAAAIAQSSILIDARGSKAYTGEAGSDAGHIPGAISIPTAGNIVGGKFADADVLRKRFADAGIDGSRQVAVYCGSGVSAAHKIAALASIGIEAALFPGSWSAWSADPGRPRATGDKP